MPNIYLNRFWKISGGQSIIRGMSKQGNSGGMSARSAGMGGVESAPVRAAKKTRERKADKPDIARFIRRTRAALSGDLYYGKPLPELSEEDRREMRATGAAVRETWDKMFAKWPNGPPYQKDRKKAMAELRAMQAKEWPNGPPEFEDFHARTRAAAARVFAEADGEGEDAGG